MAKSRMPQKSIAMTDEQWALVDGYRKQKGYTTDASTVRRIVLEWDTLRRNQYTVDRLRVLGKIPEEPTP